MNPSQTIKLAEAKKYFELLAPAAKTQLCPLFDIIAQLDLELAEAKQAATTSEEKCLDLEAKLSRVLGRKEPTPGEHPDIQAQARSWSKVITLLQDLPVYAEVESGSNPPLSGVDKALEAIRRLADQDISPMLKVYGWPEQAKGKTQKEFLYCVFQHLAQIEGENRTHREMRNHQRWAHLSDRMAGKSQQAVSEAEVHLLQERITELLSALRDGRMAVDQFTGTLNGAKPKKLFREGRVGTVGDLEDLRKALFALGLEVIQYRIDDSVIFLTLRRA